MALTVPQYVEQIRARQEQLARRLGADLRGMPEELRVVLTCSNAMTAICFRAFTQLGLITDAQIAQAFDEAVAQAFPPEPRPVVRDAAMDP